MLSPANQIAFFLFARTNLPSGKQALVDRRNVLNIQTVSFICAELVESNAVQVNVWCKCDSP